MIFLPDYGRYFAAGGGEDHMMVWHSKQPPD